MSQWRHNLNARELRKARLELGKFLKSEWGDNVPLWDDLGADVQGEKVDKFIKFLGETQNASIASELVKNREMIFELLRLKIKALRARKKTTEAEEQGTPEAGQ